MIKLTGRVTPIWVTVAHIVSMTRSEEFTRIRLSNATVIEVQETPDVILGRIDNARRREA